MEKGGYSEFVLIRSFVFPIFGGFFRFVLLAVPYSLPYAKYVNEDLQGLSRKGPGHNQERSRKEWNPKL